MVNIAEKAAGFELTGNTGTESGATVSVTIGTGSALTATSDADGTWSVSVPADASYITGTSVSVTVSASKTGFGTPADVTRTLAVDLSAPTFVSAATSTDGTQIVLTFSETLAAGAVPASAFADTVAGVPHGVYSASASGRSVTLTLRSAVGTGQAVTVAYTDPSEDDDADAVQDVAGNDAATFDAETVTNNSTVPAIYPARGDTIWAADMTVEIEEVLPGLLVLDGYGTPDSSTPDGFGSLSGSAELEYKGTNHTITGIQLIKSSIGEVTTNDLNLFIEPLFPVAPDDLLILALDGTEFRLDEAPRASNNYSWDNHGLTWTDGQIVAAKLIAIPPPSITSISVVDAPSDDLYAIGDTIDLAVTFTKAVTLDTTGGTPQLELTVGDSTRTATCAAATGTQLTCRHVVAEGIEGEIGVAANKLTLNGGVLTGPNELNADTAYAAGVVDIDVDLRVDAVRPTFVSAATSADGTQIVLVFSETLLATSGNTPAAGRFTVMAGTSAATLDGAPSVSGTTVTLTLETAVTAGQPVTVAYADLSTGDDAAVVQDLAGNDAAGFDPQTVTVAPSIISVALTSDAGIDSTYAIGDAIAVTVTFSAAVDVDGTPYVELQMEGPPKQAGCATTDGVTAVACTYTVAEGNTDPNGVSLPANPLKLVGDGQINATGTTKAAVLTYAAVADDAAHKVDGVRPTLVTTSPNEPRTSSDGWEVFLTFSEPLSKTGSGFTVVADGTNNDVEAASLNDAMVTLTLASAIRSGQAVTVAYADPTADDDENAVQDLAGNDAASFGAQTVVNLVPSTDATLSALSLSGVTLTPSFHADSLNYTGSAPHTVAMTTVSATTADTSATVDYLDGGGQALADADGNTPGLQVALEVGTPDTVKVRVTAEDGVTQKTYTAVVTRHEMPATGVTLSVEPDEVGEGQGRTELTVTGTLNGGAFGEDRTVALSVSPETAGADDFAAGTATLTIEAGQTTGTATLSLTPVADRVDEDDETVMVEGTVSGLTVTGAAVTITDDDTRGVRVSETEVEFGEGGTGAYTVVLESQPTAPVTVGVSVAGDPDVTVSPPSLQFTAGNWSAPRTVTVRAAQDADAARDTAMVSHAVSGGDYGAHGVTAASVPVYVNDDDTPSTGVTLSVTPERVGEWAGQTALRVTGTLNGAALAANTTVSLSVSAGTASASDFTAGTAALTIDAGETTGTATLSLTPVDDRVDEDDETVTVTGTVSGLTVTGATVTIADDDTRGVRVSETVLSIGEGDSGTYTVVLASRPTAAVTILVSVSGDPDVTASPPSLVFGTGNWSEPQEVTVSAAQDDDEDGDEATVSHAVSGGDYGPVTAQSVSVRVTDDDIDLEFKTAAARLHEGEETTLWVYTNGVTFETDQTVTLTLGGTATAGADYALSEPDITIGARSTGGAVTLAALEDSESEDDETITIAAHHGTSAIGSVTITIVDGTVTATVPDAPWSLLAVPGSREVALSWIAPDGQAGSDPYNGGSPVIRHEVRLDGGSWRNIPSSGEGGANEEAYTVTGLVNDREYRFAVRAVNAVGPGASTREVRSTPSGGICGRTPQVRDFILVRLHGATGCGGVTADDLASITEGLYVNYLDIASLKAGDFDGLTAVPEVDLSGNRISSLPAGIFDDLAALRWLNLDGNRLTSLPAGVFDGLAKLEELEIGDNGLRSLRARVFDRLAALEELDLSDNELASFPYAEINELANLRRLRLNGNPVYVHGVVVSKTALTIAPGGSGTYRMRLNHHPPAGAAVELESSSTRVSVSTSSVSYGRTDWFRYKEVNVTVAQNVNVSKATIRHKPVNYGSPGMATPTVTITVAQSSGDAAGEAGTDGAEREAAERDALLALLDGVTPEQASEALFGERELSGAQLDALDRLGNNNGRYDLGDLLAWTERCRNGEAKCGSTPKGPDAASSAFFLFGAAAAGRRRRSGRARRRGRRAGTMLALLLAATAWSCTGDLAGPPEAGREPDSPPAGLPRPATAPQGPGFLAVEWTAPAAGRAIGVLLELEGPGIEAVEPAAGLELYHSAASAPAGRHRIVVAGPLEDGPLVRFRVPDRGRLSLYRIRVLQVTGEDYALGDPGEYRAVAAHGPTS
ncbi:SwmB domain-containing protein [Candidatus Palauibacter polyketidifaciens]|uniref:SwmB domain-containing protein n=1 Tax=Candidatus Palauibacter polyketidifaciens TaxID=3056740 RepID=UPI00239D1B1D|nr:SwmB domain-containing protein [Candidatus Palauibacter polyketidifaciens]MDE2719308.1 SwmB domain-containing protein [Candidatus Palauibacter polyketidifaciens]